MFEFNEAEAMETGQGGTLGTGVHKFSNLIMSKAIASTGTVGFDVSFLLEGQKYRTTIYGMWCFKTNGDEIFNWKTIQRLMGLNGVKALSFFKKEIEVKNGKKMVDAAKELDGVSGTVAIQKVLDFYNGDVNEKKFEIKEFFNDAGQTYAESVKKDTNKKQFIYYSEKLQDGETTAYKKYIADGGPEEAEEAGTDTSDEENTSDDGVL